MSSGGLNIQSLPVPNFDANQILQKISNILSIPPTQANVPDILYYWIHTNTNIQLEHKNDILLMNLIELFVRKRCLDECKRLKIDNVLTKLTILAPHIAAFINAFKIRIYTEDILTNVKIKKTLSPNDIIKYFTSKYNIEEIEKKLLIDTVADIVIDESLSTSIT